jgi:hypothetical protein
MDEKPPLPGISGEGRFFCWRRKGFLASGRRPPIRVDQGRRERQAPPIPGPSPINGMGEGRTSGARGRGRCGKPGAARPLRARRARPPPPKLLGEGELRSRFGKLFLCGKLYGAALRASPPPPGPLPRGAGEGENFESPAERVANRTPGHPRGRHLPALRRFQSTQVDFVWSLRRIHSHSRTAIRVPRVAAGGRASHFGRPPRDRAEPRDGSG